jgi:penicillin-binding protein 1A
MLAGLPKAPSAYNPVVNPKRARTRQQYILQRMHELGYITDKQYETAKAEELKVKTDSSEFGVHAEYVAEWRASWCTSSSRKTPTRAA